MVGLEVTRFLSAVCAVTVLAVLAANLGLFGLDPKSAFAQWGLSAVLAQVVALFVWVVKQRQPRMRLSLVLAREASGLDPSDISWDKPCKLALLDTRGKKELKAEIPVVRNPFGQGFHVRVPTHLLTQMTEDAALSLEVTDSRGVSWRVDAFNPFDNTVELRIPRQQHAKFLAAYQDDEE